MVALGKELSRPGAGFQISARDLDLRGAGDLLSDQQAGHIHVFGPALYHHLLTRAVQGRPQHARDMWMPELRVDTPALLPESYVQDQATRLDIYARLTRAESAAELGEIEDEIEIRFGPLPPEATNLLTLAELRLDCSALGISRIDVGPSGISAQLRPDATIMLSSRTIMRSDARLISKHQIKPNQMLQAVVQFVAALKKARSREAPRRATSQSSKPHREGTAIAGST